MVGSSPAGSPFYNGCLVRCPTNLVHSKESSPQRHRDTEKNVNEECQRWGWSWPKEQWLILAGIVIKLVGVTLLSLTLW